MVNVEAVIDRVSGYAVDRLGSGGVPYGAIGETSTVGFEDVDFAAAWPGAVGAEKPERGPATLSVVDGNGCFEVAVLLVEVAGKPSRVPDPGGGVGNSDDEVALAIEVGVVSGVDVSFGLVVAAYRSTLPGDVSPFRRIRRGSCVAGELVAEGIRGGDGCRWGRWWRWRLPRFSVMFPSSATRRVVSPAAAPVRNERRDQLSGGGGLRARPRRVSTGAVESRC